MRFNWSIDADVQVHPCAARTSNLCAGHFHRWATFDVHDDGHLYEWPDSPGWLVAFGELEQLAANLARSISRVTIAMDFAFPRRSPFDSSAGVPEVAEMQSSGIRYRSTRLILGWPLVDVAFGPDPSKGEKRGHARGVVAVGDIATGWIALGAIAWGSLAIGGLAVGAIAAGGPSVGLVGIAGLTIGAIAVGGLAVGGVVMK